MRAYKDSLQALDDRVCRGVGGENDARNEGFDDLRKLYRDCHYVRPDARRALRPGACGENLEIVETSVYLGPRRMLR